MKTGNFNTACSIKKRIGVLVVTFNQYEITKYFIERFVSLFKTEYIYLLILDNNSTDGTYEKLRAQFPHLDIRILNDNYGCVTGRNIGVVELIKMRCAYIFVVDNDVYIDNRRFFDEMYSFMEENVHVAGCCPAIHWGEGRKIQTLGKRLDKLGRARNISKVPSVKVVDIDIMPGCAQFVRAKTYIKYGLYNNDLSPVSIEDYEWGMRLVKRRATFCCVSNLVVYHDHKIQTQDSKEKKAFVITGRMIFLRKYPTLFHLLSETKFVLSSIFSYGFSFVLMCYIRGLCKRLNKENYDYLRFSAQDLNTYYKSDRSGALLNTCMRE